MQSDTEFTFPKAGLKHVVLYLLLIVVLIPDFTQAQEIDESPSLLKSEAPTLRFEHLKIENGLAQGSANSMFQDSEGYVWIGTQGGLHKYDGYNFKVYSSTPFDTTSLSESWIWGISESKNGDLWIATEGGGLNKLDKATETFKSYQFDPNDSTSISSNRIFHTLEDKNGNLWVATLNRGLDRMKIGEDGKFENFRYDPDDPNSISSNTIYYLNEDLNGNVWAGSNNGVNKINSQTGAITRYLNDPDNNHGYGDEYNILDQYFPPDEPGFVWLASGNGLIKFNENTGDFDRYLIEENENGILNPANLLHEVTPDPSVPGVLWVVGPNTGVARFDARTNEFTAYKNDPKDPNSLSENFAVSLLSDRSGTLWVGYATEGLSVFNPAAVNFSHLRHDPENSASIGAGVVWGVYEDKEGTLWVGTQEGNGITALTGITDDKSNSSNKKFINDPNDNSTILPGIYRVFAEDPSGKFWVGGNGGLNKINRKTGEITRFLQENRADDIIFALQPSTEDPYILWVGTVGGLHRFDTRTEQFERVPLTLENFIRDPGVLSIFEHSSGTVYLGSNRGLVSVDLDGVATLESFYNPKDTTTISDNIASSIVERKTEPGILWLGLQNGGLNRFDIETGIATHYDKEDGMSDTHLYSILLDDNETLWMSSNNGIMNFDPETETFRNYGLDDGLMALEYNQNAFSKGSNGILYFGSGQGVTAFIPEKLKINEIPPQVVISNFKLFNKVVAIGPDSPLKKALSETDLITLKFSQNEISFDYVALHFSNSAKNQYSYQLLGFDKDWVDAGNERSATYTNLPFGDYTFRAKAANADGIWNENYTSINLKILPPWYRTYWAYALFAGLLGLFIFGFDRFQRYRISKKEEERTALREAELRAEAENKRRSDTEQLSKIGRAITSSLSVDKIIEIVYEHVNALMDAAIFSVGIYNKERNRLDFPATKEAGEMLPPMFYGLEEENRIAIWCFKNQKEIIIGDFEKEHKNYINEYIEPVAGKVSSSVIYLPLIQNKKIIGVLTTQSFKKNAYSEYHVNLLKNLATYAAIALDNASAYRQLNATLSELKTMQQQLVQQEKLASLGQLTAGIAHEIKNPLNFVNNFSDLSVELIGEIKEELNKYRSVRTNSHSSIQNSEVRTYRDTSVQDKESTPPGEENLEEISALLDDIEANLNKIHEHGSRADSIVKSMLQHSRGGSGKKAPAPLNGIAKEYVNLAFHGMRASKNPINTSLNFELDETITDVSVITEDFSRVIINLCNNAFDAMRDKLNSTHEDYKPVLTIRTKKVDGEFILEIEDNGPGIPPEIKDKIMQPFFTTKKGTEGTGLGLSITNDIIKAHGGKLEIYSEENQYTLFRVYLNN